MKATEEEKLFDYLIEEIKKTDTNRIRQKYADAFECFGDKYIPSEKETILLDTLKNVENDKWDKKSLSALRDLLEAVYKKLHDYDDELLPYECVHYREMKVNLFYCYLLLTGKDVRKSGTGEIMHSPKYTTKERLLPKHLDNLLNPIQLIIQKSSHDDDDVANMNIYTLRAITFGVMDFLIWFKKYVDKFYLKDNYE